MAREAGRDPASIEITSFGLGEDLDRVNRLAGKPGLSALADQCALEFGERREQVKGELPVNRAGVDPFGQRPEFDPAFLKSARQRDQVRHRAAEPVETPHDELIAAARHFQGQRQTRSRRLGAADPILIDPSAAGPGQRVALQIEILIVG
jgi:hypothetical protein